MPGQRVNRSIVEQVAMIAGHKTRAVFDRHPIVNPHDLQEAAQKLAEPVSATGTTTAGQVKALPRKRKLWVAKG